MQGSDGRLAALLGLPFLGLVQVEEFGVIDNARPRQELGGRHLEELHGLAVRCEEDEHVSSLASTASPAVEQLIDCGAGRAVL